MPGLVRENEKQAAIDALETVARREYRRGLEMGWQVAEIACEWLRSTKGIAKKPAFTHEHIARMIEARIESDKNREGR